jgi:hypothetical protein
MLGAIHLNDNIDLFLNHIGKILSLNNIIKFNLHELMTFVPIPIINNDAGFIGISNLQTFILREFANE